MALLLVFKVIGLFDLDIGEFSASSVEPRNLKNTELINEIDILEVKVKRLNRRRDEIKNIVTALEENRSYTEAAYAGGMRRATRKSQ